MRARRLTSLDATNGLGFRRLLGLISEGNSPQLLDESLAFSGHFSRPPSPDESNALDNESDDLADSSNQTGMAEVSRNRTDRSTRGRPTGFEVLGEHQPACTSTLILSNFAPSVNRSAGTMQRAGEAREIWHGVYPIVGGKARAASKHKWKV